MDDTLPNAARVLEWPRLLALLAEHAQSVQGEEKCRAPLLAVNLAEARSRQQETTDMVELLDRGEPMPDLRFPDLRDIVKRAAKGGELTASELWNCAVVIAVLEAVVGYAARHVMPGSALGRVVEPLRAVMRKVHPIRLAIEGAIEPGGSVKESATPTLTRLAQHAHELKQTMRERLERMLHSPTYREVLQELYFAQREGRYVLPVKAEMRGRVSGIVHDVSVSGATVFLEPHELIELNNAIKVAELNVEREVRRILHELTLLVVSHADAIAQGAERLAEWDCLHAKAELSRRLQCHPVSLNEEGRVVLKQARHPLLVVSREQVVPNDIIADETVRVLVISGPNTGGKTVALKMIGLYSFMVRAGLHVPCAPESEMALFTRCYADIGDAQDLSRDLSSFSAHIVQIVQLLSEANREEEERGLQGMHTMQTLVLLDEPVTSTDPEEGAALAEAVLCRLAMFAMKVVVTTHYRTLKELAQTTPGFANASVGLDMERLAPTYKLFMGIPGKSSALEIASRLGMDRDIIDDARRRLHPDGHRLDRMMADLQLQQQRLIEDLERARRAREEAEQAAVEARILKAKLEREESAVRKVLRRKVDEQLRQAWAEVRAMVDAIKREQRPREVGEIKRRFNEVEERVKQIVTPTDESVPVEQLDVGDRVEIAGLGMRGSLLERPAGKKRVRVKVGEGEIMAAVSNLIGLPRQAQASDLSPTVQSSTQGSPFRTDRRSLEEENWHVEAETVIDVRGCRADDALDRVVSVLDRAMLNGVSTIRIVHGHGTGRLKAALHDYLKGSPYVAEFHLADRAAGGDGVTVVKLL
ncbi:MAG: Smr/MutS family protein [Nitrospira sp.]|nr:Smr/MutS family protein [Nitrospira sp.]